MKKTIIFILLLLLSMGLLAGCGEQGLDLKEYVDISFSGVDGYGKIEFDLDEENLLHAVYGGKEDSKDMEETFATMLLLEEINIKADTYEELANGDKITLTITYPDKLSEALGVALSPKSGSSWTVTVSDLKKMLELNPFDSYEVSFSGYDGMGKATVTDNRGYALTSTDSQKGAQTNGEKNTVILAPKKGGELTEYGT